MFAAAVPDPRGLGSMTVSIPPARFVAGCLEVDRPQGDLCRVAPWPDLGVRSVYPGLAVPAGEDEFPIDVSVARHEWVGILPPVEPFRKRGRETEQLLLLSVAPAPVGGQAGESAVAWREFLGRIPLEILEHVVRFRPPHLHLLRSIARHPSMLDLVGSTPALAWMLAHAGEFLGDGHPPLVPGEMDRLVASRQRLIAARLGLGDTTATIRLLRKLPTASVQVGALRAVRRLLRNADRAAFLAHLPKVNVGVLLLLDSDEGERLATDSLCREVADQRAEDHEPDTLMLLQDLGRMAVILRRPLDRYRSIAAVRHDHAEMVHQMNQRPRAPLRQEPVVHRPVPITRVTTGDIFPPPPFPGLEDGSITPLTSSSALDKEGEAMHHCVAAYGPLVQMGSLYIYRVLRPQRATVELRMDGREWQLGQLKGRDNREVSDGTRQAVVAWLAQARRYVARSSHSPRVRA